MRHYIVFILTAVVVGASFARAEEDFHQKKIPLKAVITEIPETSVDFLSRSFSKEAFPWWTLIIGTTAITYHYDADLFEGSQRQGRQWGLSNVDKTRTVWKAGQYDLLRLPTDTASALYFLGDGWTDFAVAGALFANGAIYENVRPYNTALQLVHGMTVSALFVQALKRASGRESPSERSEPRGAWRPFPSVKAYNAHTSKYDAMPSGHVMTSTLVFTIIRSNYPEYDYFLLPLEVGWITVLGFAMMNNAVHWASDYPLAIGMGWVIGKASLKLGQKREKNKEIAEKPKWDFYPGLASDDHTMTLNAVYAF